MNFFGNNIADMYHELYTCLDAIMYALMDMVFTELRGYLAE